MTHIPMADLKAEWTLLKEPVTEVVNEVLASGSYVLGEKGDELEKRLSSRIGTAYGIGTASGTDALKLSLQALDIGPGDEVITTPFTFFASAGAIAQTGATPVFADIDADTYNLDPDRIEKAVSHKARAIIIVHLYGKAAPMEAIMELADAYGLRVIEDACQAIGTEYHGKQVGSIGDLGCFSFFPSKNLGAFGDAGLVTTDDPQLSDRVRQLRNHGSSEKYYHTTSGTNSRLDEVQAAVLLAKLPYLDTFLQQRQAIARRYTDNLSPLLTKPETVKDRAHTFHQYNIELNHRDELAAALTHKNIATAIYYPVPLHLQPAFSSLGYQKGDFPIAEKAADHVLALPIFPTLSRQQQDNVIQAVNTFMENQH
ncbi:DegT/DnrJ/EryC1/StrS family aminotransferase [Barrientosiimonas marina]|uniref:DegT/DnrJ/EryC1/StrS family aminotransferase n=1 Tax=Lentibacillus kimchii TaxID=1542911 RepID=A0ABW2UV19_9BACI